MTYVPALDLLSTFGPTKEEALEKTSEAILGYIEAAAKGGLPVPDSPVDAELVSVEISVVSSGPTFM